MKSLRKLSTEFYAPVPVLKRDYEKLMDEILLHEFRIQEFKDWSFDYKLSVCKDILDELEPLKKDKL